MRGKAVNSKNRANSDRITPAYAGKRPWALFYVFIFWDHPRLCGEKSGGKDSTIVLAGITPAYAGKSNANDMVFRFHKGSPPPMRGKVRCWWNGAMVQRITPAYAGKSFKRFFARSMYQDHPRLCGEKLFIEFVPLKQMGSPPPMRGKVLNFSVADFPFGITPAYAGKSCKASMQLSHHRDHPRLCGEKHGTFI